MELRRRWSKGVQFQVSYTYSRINDVQSDPIRALVPKGRGGGLADVGAFFQPLGSFSAFTRQFDSSADYGRSDFGPDP